MSGFFFNMDPQRLIIAQKYANKHKTGFGPYPAKTYSRVGAIPHYQSYICLVPEQMDTTVNRRDDESSILSPLRFENELDQRKSYSGVLNVDLKTQYLGDRAFPGSEEKGEATRRVPGVRLLAKEGKGAEGMQVLPTVYISI